MVEPVDSSSFAKCESMSIPSSGFGKDEHLAATDGFHKTKEKRKEATTSIINCSIT